MIEFDVVCQEWPIIENFEFRRSQISTNLSPPHRNSGCVKARYLTAVLIDVLVVEFALGGHRSLLQQRPRLVQGQQDAGERNFWLEEVHSGVKNRLTWEDRTPSTECEWERKICPFRPQILIWRLYKSDFGLIAPARRGGQAKPCRHTGFVSLGLSDVFVA